MDTEVLKRTIGAKCLVLDPRSKCCEFKMAKVISAVNTFQNDNNNNRRIASITGRSVVNTFQNDNINNLSFPV